MAGHLLWAEDLESHREPALYYLGEEEGADGPHLICDWNGSPTEYNELEVDMLSMFRQSQSVEANSCAQASKEQNHDHLAHDSDNDNYPNPTTEFAKSLPNSNPNFILGGADRLRLDLLTVPPTATGLLKRIVRSARMNKLTNPSPPPKTRQMPPIQESDESRPNSSRGISKQLLSKTARVSTGGLLKERKVYTPRSQNKLADKTSLSANGTPEHPVVVE